MSLVIANYVLFLLSSHLPIFFARFWLLNHIAVGILECITWFDLIRKHANLNTLGAPLSLIKRCSTLDCGVEQVLCFHYLPEPSVSPSYPLGLVIGHQFIDGGRSGHFKQDWLGRGFRAGRHMTQRTRWGTSSLALALHSDSSCHTLGARVWQASDVFWECQHLGLSFPFFRLIRWGVACQTQKKKEQWGRQDNKDGRDSVAPAFWGLLHWEVRKRHWRSQIVIFVMPLS